MIDQFYGFLAQIGFSHPLHPPITHGPIGAVIVAFFLGLASKRWPDKNLTQAAYYVIIVGFILLFPTIIAGILDWQHFFSGALITQIRVKITLAFCLFVLLSLILIVGRNKKNHNWIMQSLTTLCLFNVLGLGYFGGQLIYEGRLPDVGDSHLAGRKIFEYRCSGCHVNGGNIIKPNLPLRSAPQLENFERFLAFVRNPKMPSGHKGPMPAFTPKKLSDQDARELYSYIIIAFSKPLRTDQ